MPDWPASLIAAWAALAGAAIGSFIGTVLVRLPEERSVLTGRSACDACGTRIGVRDLVPLVSWLALRGQCRHCRAPIGLWQIGCELGGATVAAAAVLLAPAGLALPAMVLGWQLLLLGVIDARHLWLPRPQLAAAREAEDKPRIAAIVAELGNLKANAEAAHVAFQSEKEALLARGEYYNPVVLGAMEQFVAEAPAEIADGLAKASH